MEKYSRLMNDALKGKIDFAVLESNKSEKQNEIRTPHQTPDTTSEELRGRISALEESLASVSELAGRLEKQLLNVEKMCKSMKFGKKS